MQNLMQLPVNILSFPVVNVNRIVKMIVLANTYLASPFRNTDLKTNEIISGDMFGFQNGRKFRTEGFVKGSKTYEYLTGQTVRYQTFIFT